jgi:hypothetical protein
MEKIIITIETVNAAFEENGIGEVARILRKLADDMEYCESAKMPVFDINGNSCGKVEVK